MTAQIIDNPLRRRSHELMKEIGGIEQVMALHDRLKALPENLRNQDFDRIVQWAIFGLNYAERLYAVENYEPPPFQELDIDSKPPGTP